MTDFPMLDVARSLRFRIEQFADQTERERDVPQALAEELARAGLFKMLVPKDYGGSELTPEEYLLVLEELGKADGSTAWVVGLLASNSISSAYLPAKLAQEIFADNPCAAMAGSLAPKLRRSDEPPNRALVVDGGYRISGKWSFASGCRHATVIMALCQVYAADKPRMQADGRPEQRWFYVSRQDCRILDDWCSAGLSGTGSHGFVIEDVFLPDERTLPASSPFHAVHSGALYKFGAGSPFGDLYLPLAGISRVTLTGVCLGIARGMMDAFIELASVGHGVSRLRESTIVHDRVGQAEAILRAARAYQFDAQEKAWQKVLREGRQSSDILKELALAGTHTIMMLSQAVELIWRAAGIAAVFVPGPFERRLRDIHVATQNAGISQAHYALFGQHMLR